MSFKLGFAISGGKKLIKTLRPELIGGPLRDWFLKVTFKIEGEAKKRAPVFQGRLRSSISTDVDKAVVPLWGSVGTNVVYAPMMEFGTGLLHDGPGGANAPHWPPSQALDSWASAHGIPGGGFVVARSIGLRGGLKPRRFLRDGAEASLVFARSAVGAMGKQVGIKFARGA